MAARMRKPPESQDGPSVMHKIAESIVRMHDRPLTFANWLNAFRFIPLEYGLVGFVAGNGRMD